MSNTTIYNKVLVGMFDRFPEKQGMLMKGPKNHTELSNNEVHYGLYIESTHKRSRIVTSPDDKMKDLKNLAAHMIDKAEKYYFAKKKIIAAQASVEQLQKSDIDEEFRSCSIEAISKRKLFYSLEQSEAYNALIMLYALLFLDFSDLSLTQRSNFLHFLASQKGKMSDDLSPTQIVNIKRKMPWNYDIDTVYFSGEKIDQDPFISAHFEITEEGYGVYPWGLSTQDLKLLDLPIELKRISFHRRD